MPDSFATLRLYISYLLAYYKAAPLQCTIKKGKVCEAENLSGNS